MSIITRSSLGCLTKRRTSTAPTARQKDPGGRRGIWAAFFASSVRASTATLVFTSRVKSVTLDSWTPEQIESIQKWGNAKVASLYERNIPDGYRRPQNDIELESFIRAKYERKQFIARDGDVQSAQHGSHKAHHPPKHRASDVAMEPKNHRIDDRAKGAVPKPVEAPKASPVRPPPPSTNVHPHAPVHAQAPAAASLAAHVDLLSLGETSPAAQRHAAPAAVAPVQSKPSSGLGDLDFLAGGSAAPASGGYGAAPTPSTSSDFGDLFGAPAKQQVSKDSILSLYAQPTPTPGSQFRPQMQQQPQPGMGAYGAYPGGIQGGQYGAAPSPYGAAPSPYGAAPSPYGAAPSPFAQQSPFAQPGLYGMPQAQQQPQMYGAYPNTMMMGGARPAAPAPVGATFDSNLWK
eukprot:Opistho-2@74320